MWIFDVLDLKSLSDQDASITVVSDLPSDMKQAIYLYRRYVDIMFIVT